MNGKIKALEREIELLKQIIELKDAINKYPKESVYPVYPLPYIPTYHQPYVYPYVTYGNGTAAADVTIWTS